MVKRASSENRLRVLRAERRLTQINLARRLGMSQGTYCLIENGHREATRDERSTLARIFRVSQDELGFPPLSASDAHTPEASAR